jgi:hypothetical protein
MIQQQWSRPIMLILGVVALMIPGIRRQVFFRILKNPLLRNLGLRLVVSIPFVRERMMSRILPTR